MGFLCCPFPAWMLQLGGGCSMRKLGRSKSKVLILRIPIEWWDELEKLKPPPRETIRMAIKKELGKKKIA